MDWSGLGAAIASMVFLWSMIRQYLPHHFDHTLMNYANKVIAYVNPYVDITFHEYTGERYFQRSEAYTTIKAYLGATTSKRAKKLKGEINKTSSNVIISMDDHEQVTDEYNGAKMWWSSTTKTPKGMSISFYPGMEEQRFYTLTFHRRHRELVMENYLAHVMQEGKAATLRSRQRKLFSNNRSKNWSGYNKSVWNSAPFEHPATFETLAMDPEKKQEIIEDLRAFTNGKYYYKNIGRAWKRGYLLYGPPGTGKSSTVAAMANFLDYDVYDLELTAVKTNVDLRMLLINTTSKAIVVIEDIDCSLDLSGKRKNEEKTKEQKEEKKLPPKPDIEESSKVTLSGLLNFIDGLWSSCGEERLIVFTTNHLEKLDLLLYGEGEWTSTLSLPIVPLRGSKCLLRTTWALIHTPSSRPFTH